MNELESRSSPVGACGCLGGLCFLVLGFLVLVIAPFAGQAKGHREPGHDAFLAAHKSIDSYEGRIGLGNGATAQSYAASFAARFDAAQRERFPKLQSKTTKGSPTAGKVLAYCCHRPGKTVFLVHVPRLTRFDGKDREALMDLAWKTAVATIKSAPEHRLAVALRGSLFYGGYLIGKGDGTTLSRERAAVVKRDALFEFFAVEAEKLEAPVPAGAAPKAGG